MNKIALIKKPLLQGLFLGAFLFFFSACSSSKQKQSSSSETQLLFWGNMKGEVLPCSCGLRPFGGLERSYNFQQKHAFSKSLKIDYGNSLLSPKLKSDLKKKKRASKILKAYQAMGGVVYGLGASELKAWPLHEIQNLFNHTANTALLSNKVFEGAWKKFSKIRPFIDLKSPQMTFRIYSILTKSVASFKIPKEAPHKIFQRILAQTPEHVLPVILNTDLEDYEAEQLLKKLKRPVLFLGSVNQLDNPEFIAQKNYLMSYGHSEGKSLSLLRWSSKAKLKARKDLFAERFSPQSFFQKKHYAYSFLYLKPDYDGANAVSKILRAP